MHSSHPYEKKDTEWGKKLHAMILDIDDQYYMLSARMRYGIIDFVTNSD